MSLNALTVHLRFDAARPLKVGTLARAGRDFVFQYDDPFLQLGLAISPLRLPLRPGVHVYDGRGRMDLFGVFEDALPDSWGRRLIDRHFQRTAGRAPEVLERLACVGDRAMGALTFHPPEEVATLPHTGSDLAVLAQQAWEFDNHRVEDALPELRRVAGTSGGARPKVLVGLPATDATPAPVLPGDADLPPGYAHWIVKFNTQADGPDAGPLEFAYAELAAAAGADVPGHRLIETPAGRFFAARRFERPAPARRLHLHSAAGLLHADFRTAGDEYDVLFRLTESLTHDHAQCCELFRRACLNVLACNRDDHLKNFAYLMDHRGIWRLAPLFDFTFHPGPNGWQTLSVAGEGRNPRRSHLLQLAAQVDLKPKDARAIIEQVRAALAGFPALADRLKLTPSTTAQVLARIREMDA
jgi:serine/threonine-protein kinase HipA